MADPTHASRPVFLVESFAALSEADHLAAADRAAAAAAELAVTYLGATVVPGDELAYHVFAAPDTAAVGQACARAALPVERIVPALALRAAHAAGTSQSLPIGFEEDRPVGHATGEIGP